MKKNIVYLFIIFSLSLMAKDIQVDKNTGLIWQDSSSIVKKNYSEAKRYCENLTLDGHNNWRLPYIDELLSIVDTNKTNPAIKNIFKYTESDYYWSDTEYKENISKAWYVLFYGGNSNYGYKSDENYVRCVIDGQ